jgi:hypothetical protein
MSEHSGWHPQGGARILSRAATSPQPLAQHAAGAPLAACCEKIALHVPRPDTSPPPTAAQETVPLWVGTQSPANLHFAKPVQLPTPSVPAPTSLNAMYSQNHSSAVVDLQITRYSDYMVEGVYHEGRTDQRPAARWLVVLHRSRLGQHAAMCCITPLWRAPGWIGHRTSSSAAVHTRRCPQRTSSQRRCPASLGSAGRACGTSRPPHRSGHTCHTGQPK